MKSDELLEMIGDVDDSIIADAKNTTKKQKSHGWIKWASLAACLCAVAVIGVVFIMKSKGPDNISDTESSGADKALQKQALVTAVYPETVPFPHSDDYISDDEFGFINYDAYSLAYEQWRDNVNKLHSVVVGNTDGFKAFNQTTIRNFLSGTKENQCYSPVNLYIALAMLTEVTEGETQEEILQALGYSNIEELRALCKGLWEISYRNDGSNFSIPASSIWLSDKEKYNIENLQRLADNYYASSFSGDMSSDYYTSLFRDWINYQTGDLLKEQTSNLKFNPDTVLALVTTLFFREKWQNEFFAPYNVNDIFHSPDGDTQCEFMTQGGTDTYYYGDKFGAVILPFDHSTGEMSFILPDEGISCDELLADEEAMDFILTGNRSWSNSKLLIVNKMIPKFDISSNLQLKDKLEGIGISKVFTPNKDFAPLYKGTGPDTNLSKVEHAVRVAIDEEGVTAASYTVEIACGAAEPPKDKVDFFLTRPFIFVIKNSYGLPLFVGVVNQP